MDIDLSELDGVPLDGLEFCRVAFRLFEDARASEDGVRALRARSTRNAKDLVDEILPICKYVLLSYRPGRYLKVEWIQGNQGFDAKLAQSGDYVRHGEFSEYGHLEVAAAMHENEYLSWRLMNEGVPVFGLSGIEKQARAQPVSRPVVRRGQSHVKEFLPSILRVLKKKAQISYPDSTSLILCCSLNGVYLEEDWRYMISEVKSKAPSSSFQEILIFDSTRERAEFL